MSNQMTSADIDWLYPSVHVKDQVKVFGGGELFWTPHDRISHCIHIVRTTCSQLPARSGVFCLLVDIVYGPSGLKFVHPTINLAFLRIIVNVKLPAKFRLHSFEWFCLQIINDENYFFLSNLRHYDRGLNV